MVGEAVLAPRIPEMLCRIQLRAVGRQEGPAQVLRHGQLVDPMPARLVHDHADEFVGVTLRHLVQEQRHRLGVDPGQQQAAQDAVVRAGGAEGVDVLACALAARQPQGACRGEPSSVEAFRAGRSGPRPGTSAAPAGPDQPGARPLGVPYDEALLRAACALSQGHEETGRRGGPVWQALAAGTAAVAKCAREEHLALGVQLAH